MRNMIFLISYAIYFQLNSSYFKDDFPKLYVVIYLHVLNKNDKNRTKNKQITEKKKTTKATNK